MDCEIAKQPFRRTTWTTSVPSCGPRVSLGWPKHFYLLCFVYSLSAIVCIWMSRRPPGRDSNSPPTRIPTNSFLLQSPSRPELSSLSTSSAHDLSSGLVYPSQLPQRHSFQSPTFERAMTRNILREASFESPSRSDMRSDDPGGRRGSPSSSSQGDMQDSDMDSGPSSQPEQSSGPRTSDQPAKKKRTRTLTTPHQSAVLHALLAQVSFSLFASFHFIDASV
jgi:hypothetical protein